MLLNEVEAKQMLKEAGIKVTDTRFAATRSKAVAISKEIGFPAVLKILSPDIVHKSDCGGVKLDLRTAEEVGQAYDEMMKIVSKASPHAKISGVSVQKMTKLGVEVILGVSRDDQFGPFIIFGLGGVMVEVLKDVSFRVVPVSSYDAAQMIREIKGFNLLAGFRGQPAVDLPALEQMIVELSRFVEANPKIKELDLNPVFAYPEGAVAVDTRIVMEETDSVSMQKRAEKIPAPSLDSFFHPKSIAVMGASNNSLSRGYDFMTHLLTYGYKGKIYPVNPKQSEILGIKAYARIEDIPGEIDFVIYCIGLEQAPAFLDSCGKKGVKAVHIFSARGSETGRAEFKALEVEILKRAKDYGIRLIGPNCMGVYCPETGISFSYDFPKEKGHVGAMIQSGGSATDIVRLGSLQGLRFSKVVSYGNALDVNEMDLLRYLAEDPETSVILAFIEGLRGNGREFLELVRSTSKKKPFILCKGGRSKSGARCTQSHTASLAGASPLWDIVLRQAGGISVRDIDDLVYMAVGFSFLKPVKGRRVGTGGSGGGRNTMSVDQWEDHGFEIVPLPNEIREEFKQRGALLWYCLDNPADRSIAVPNDPFTVPALLRDMASHPDFDFICADIAAEEYPYHKDTFEGWVAAGIEDYIKLYKEGPKPFFMIFRPRPIGTPELDHWFWREVSKMRSRLVEEKVPIFPSVDKAAEVLNAMIAYHARRKNGD
jgi:acyl-CoA synthetase (NDP forming)